MVETKRFACGLSMRQREETDDIWIPNVWLKHSWPWLCHILRRMTRFWEGGTGRQIKSFVIPVSVDDTSIIALEHKQSSVSTPPLYS